jgi:hypothetical protein
LEFDKLNVGLTTTLPVPVTLVSYVQPISDGTYMIRFDPAGNGFKFLNVINSPVCLLISLVSVAVRLMNDVGIVAGVVAYNVRPVT